MQTLGVYLIFAAVLLRTAVLVSDRPEFPIIIALLACYGLLLFGKIWWVHRKPIRFLQSRTLQVSYLFLQSALVVGTLILSEYEDFLAMLFIPLSLDAIFFFGRRAGFISIALFSLGMIFTLLFSNVGPFFGLVMGILYSGICFLVGGYAYQVQNARTAHERNEQMLQELQIAHRQLQGYADQRANLAIEQERNRLARELHDSVTQTVFSMNLAAQSAHLLLDKRSTPRSGSMDKEPQRAAGQLLHLEELAASALHEIQSLVSQLRPRSIVEEGLPTALRRLVVEQKTQGGLQISLEVQGEEMLSEKVATNLYSITHEALINVSRHSGVCEAIVRLSLGKDRSCLEIEDRGRGFDPETALDQRGHLGLVGMSERAREIGWNLSVLSRPGQGTRILVTDGFASPSGGPT